MEYFRYQLKKSLFILFFWLSILIFSVTLDAQQPDERVEKQLKIFQLSYFLEEGDGFPRENAYFNNAFAYLENEHFSLAIGELEKIEYNSLYIPLYLKSQFLRAQCYEKVQRWESAIGVYQDLLIQVPVMQEYVLYLLGRAYQNINEASNARKAYLQVIKEYPPSGLTALVHYQSALLYLEDNQWEQFWQGCSLALEAAPEEKFKAKILAKMSDMLWEDGKFIDSLKYLKEIIENRYEREKISFQENLYLNRFQTVQQNGQLEIPPNLSLFFTDLLFNYHRYKIAEMVYEEIIEKYAEQIDLVQIQYNKARAIYYQGDYERAINQCLYILDNFDQEEITIRTLYLYAGALLSTGNRSQASEKYHQIIERFPENYFAQVSYLRLSEIEFLQDRKEEGINFLKQLLSEYPESSPAQEAAWKLARYYTNQNLISEALPYYKFIYEHFPLSSQADDALYWMGKLLYLGDSEEGIKVFKELLSQFPDSYYSFRVPAEVGGINGKLKDLITHSKEVSLEQFKKNYSPRGTLAQLSAYRAEILMFLKLYQESILELSYALQQEPDNVYLQLLLTQGYAKAEEYYRSNSYAQALLNYFLINNKEIPSLIWEYAFPLYFADLVEQTAISYHLDPFLVWSIMREESHFNPYAESRAGARGLMQIIFSTGEWIAQKLNHKEFNYDLLFTPEINISFGCWYMQYLQERFNKNNFLIISGYNAGPGITDQWIETFDISDIDVFVENIPYQETTEHIKKVIRSYLIYQIIYKN